MDLEGIIPSEKQVRYIKLYGITYIWNLKTIENKLKAKFTGTEKNDY